MVVVPPFPATLVSFMDSQKGVTRGQLNNPVMSEFPAFREDASQFIKVHQLIKVHYTDEISLELSHFEEWATAVIQYVALHKMFVVT